MDTGPSNIPRSTAPAQPPLAASTRCSASGASGMGRASCAPAGTASAHSVATAHRVRVRFI